MLVYISQLYSYIVFLWQKKQCAAALFSIIFIRVTALKKFFEETG